MRLDPYMKLKDIEELTAVTPRRIAAAKAAIRRKHNELPPIWRQLKGDPTETPEERIAKINAERVAGIKEFRSKKAALWLRARKVRRGLPGRVVKMFDCLWKDSTYPGAPEYALTLMNTLIRVYYGFDAPKDWFKCERLKCDKCIERATELGVSA
jgi:hypothetical protein